MAESADAGKRIPILIAMILSTLMYTLDSTIANVALPHIQGSLSASQDQITWVLTSYILATAVMTPLSGWLSMKFGRKRVLLFAVVGFTLTSMLCGIATNVPEMVTFRLAQGLAGASLIPVSQSVMLDIFEPHEIPRVMSIWSAAVIMGPILGPTVGGWITEHLSWRWVFYINVPIGILATLGLYVFMARDPGGRQRPFDVLGFASLVAFVVGLQVFLDRGPTQDWFDSHEVWFELAIACAGLWVFAAQTATAEHPFFHRDLAKDANFVGTTIFSFFVGVLLFSTTALLPSFMQNLLGYSAMESGVTSMWRGVGSLISFLLVPNIVARIGARQALFIGLVLCITSLWMMSRFDLSMDQKPLIISGFIQGAGTGLLFAPLTTLAFTTLSPSHRVEGTILSTMARSLGSSVGISVVQALVVRESAVAHTVLAGGIDASSPVIRSALPLAMDPTTPTGLLVLNGEITRQSSMIGYVDIFSWMTLFVCALIPLLLILRPPAKGAPPQRREAHAD